MSQQLLLAAFTLICVYVASAADEGCANICGESVAASNGRVSTSFEIVCQEYETGFAWYRAIYSGSCDQKNYRMSFDRLTDAAPSCSCSDITFVSFDSYQHLCETGFEWYSTVDYPISTEDAKVWCTKRAINECTGGSDWWERTTTTKNPACDASDWQSQWRNNGVMMQGNLQLESQQLESQSQSQLQQLFALTVVLLVAAVCVHKCREMRKKKEYNGDYQQIVQELNQ